MSGEALSNAPDLSATLVLDYVVATGATDASGQPDFFQFVNGGRQFILGMTYRM